ncbi:MAG: CDP-diacylglycerol--glycerol-3-phosphate 3-phosphatidyltransferase [Micrococcaceae bacterium]
MVEKQAPEQVSNWNIANYLTVLRIVLVPVFIWFLMAPVGQYGQFRWGALAIFCIAAITDKIDGDIARSRGLITDFGKLADPIADKALLGSGLICLSILHEIPWWITVLILIREIGITLLRFVVKKYEVVPASKGGKLKTVLQIAALIMFILPIQAVFGDIGNIIAWITLIAATFVTVVTGLDYVKQMLSMIREKKAAQE